MSLPLKSHIAKARAFLGRGATINDVAIALRCSPANVKRRLSAKELHLWATDVKMHTVDRQLAAIRKVRMNFLKLRRRPTARESGVHSSVQTEMGGYNKVVEASCLPSR